MELLYIGIIIFLFVLAISDLIVGVSNDAVNFLNSAVGAKSARFRTIMLIAAVGVMAGAVMSNGMMDIARHGIYQPQFFSFSELICIMLAVMVTDVLLLDGFNTMGMPTSTTVSLVFELLGGTVAIAMIKSIASDGALTFAQMINTEKALSVVLGIFLSIVIAFFFGALVQYITRIIFTFNYKRRLKWFAGIFGGIAVTAIFYFMVIKGLKDAAFMTKEKFAFIQENTWLILGGCFIVSAIIMQILHWCKINVFKVVVLIGTFALAMAFAGNDLVNFIGVPLAGLSAFQDYAANGTAVGGDNYMMGSLLEPAKTPSIYLLLAGGIMVFALTTSKKAKKVIGTSVSLSRQDDSDEMFGSSSIARKLVLFFSRIGNGIVKITPVKVTKWIDSRFNKNEIILENGAAFDQLRAAVNLVMASLLIALGTSYKLPLSTTFVTFMVAMGSSLADRAWGRESAVFRVTGTISVIGGWLLTAAAAFIFSFIIALIMHFGGFIAMILLSIISLIVIIRSNIRYNRKAKETEKETTYTKILATGDKDEIWNLLKKFIKENVLHDIEYISKGYNSTINCFINEDRRCLKKLQSSLNSEIHQRKTLRKKEILTLKRCDSIITLKANTWCNIITNNSIQLMYGLKRMEDPCREHIENNFNSLPRACKEELMPLRFSLKGIFDKSSEYVEKLSGNEDNMQNPAFLIKEMSRLKLKITEAMNDNMIRFGQEEGSANYNVYVLYQNILQEMLQMADDLKHLLRAYYNMNIIKN